MGTPEIPITKRLIMAGRTVAAMGILVLSIDCGPQHTTPTLERTPTISSTPTLESPHSDWDRLPALSRLKMLREDRYPKLEGFDRQKEDTKAVVDFFCQNVRCNIPSDIILNNHIEYVSPENFAEKLKERGFNYSKEQIEERKQLTAFVTRSLTYTNRVLFFNNAAFETEVRKRTESQPEFAQIQFFNNYLEQTIKFHELGHLNSPTGETYLSEPFKNGDFTIYKLIGFVVVARDEGGNDAFLSGVSEAVTELLAQKIRLRSGFDLTNPSYQDGVNLLSQLVSEAGISDEEFIEYTDGRKSISEFIARIGALKKNESYNTQTVGINALYEIGSITEHLVDPETGKKYLNSILNVQIK